MPSKEEAELETAIARVLRSDSRKKLIVAGPGTGKTALFHRLLASSPGDRDSRLVLTFINNLKEDLTEDLSDLAHVFTLHGYCQSLLYRHAGLRQGLSPSFRCFPRLASLIESDWKFLRAEALPQFVKSMRNLRESTGLDFYLARGNYYDAVDFDDSVYRVYVGLQGSRESADRYDLILIDEYQDFNRMEASIIDLLGDQNSIVIAGDDDQALYSQLRGSSWEFIRSLYHGAEFERFELPFCMRCPEVIVDAVNDVIGMARQLKKLEGRIEKPYKHFAPVKGADSKRYPTIALIATTVQRGNANYFGRYIVQAIEQIPPIELEEAATKGDPALLIIASQPYRDQIVEHLTRVGYPIDTKRDARQTVERSSGLQFLKENTRSNLGWRVILHFEKIDFASSVVRSATEKSLPLVDVIPPDFQRRILEEVGSWEPAAKEPASVADGAGSAKSPSVKVTSFEGAKGLSAQHVFIVGLHDGELPRDSRNIQDIEICRFLVGLTRTRKRCNLLHTRRFADQFRRPSPFLSWIRRERYELIEIDAQYWKVR